MIAFTSAAVLYEKRVTQTARTSRVGPLPASGLFAVTVTAQSFETMLPVCAETFAEPGAIAVTRARLESIEKTSTAAMPVGEADHCTVPLTSALEPSSKVAVAVTPENAPGLSESDGGVTVSDAIRLMPEPPSDPASAGVPESPGGGFGSTLGGAPQAAAISSDRRRRRRIDRLRTRCRAHRQRRLGVAVTLARLRTKYRAGSATVRRLSPSDDICNFSLSAHS